MIPRMPTFVAAVIAAVFMSLAFSTARADFALPAIKERFVLLLSGEAVALQTQGRNVSARIAPLDRTFPVHRGYLQERIASQGLDVNDFSASENRVEAVTGALKEAPKCPTRQLEIARHEGEKDFVISYISVFQTEKDYARYYPERAIADTIEITSDVKPENSEAWQKSLRGMTEAAIKQLRSAK